MNIEDSIQHERSFSILVIITNLLVSSEKQECFHFNNLFQNSTLSLILNNPALNIDSYSYDLSEGFETILFWSSYSCWRSWCYVIWSKKIKLEYSNI